MNIHRHIVFLLIAPDSMALALAQLASAPTQRQRAALVRNPCTSNKRPRTRCRLIGKSAAAIAAIPCTTWVFMKAPPELPVQKVPHRTKSRGKTLHLQWVFPPSAQQYGVACEYPRHLYGGYEASRQECCRLQGRT